MTRSRCASSERTGPAKARSPSSIRTAWPGRCWRTWAIRPVPGMARRRPGGHRTQCLEGRPRGGGQAGALRPRWRPGGDLCARPTVDGTGPRVAGVPAGQPSRVSREFPGHPRDRCRRSARLDRQQYPDRRLPEIRGRHLRQGKRRGSVRPPGEPNPPRRPGNLRPRKRRGSALRRVALGQPRRGYQRRHREAPPQRLASPAGMRVRPGLYAADGVGLRPRTARSSARWTWKTTWTWTPPRDAWPDASWTTRCAPRCLRG